MSRMLSVFMLAPVLRGLIAMMVAGAAFPLCGVMVVKLNLIPLRYMMMHGVILGGAVSLAFGVPLVASVSVVNVALVFLMLAFTGGNGHGFGGSSAAVMVVSMALASVLTHVKDVPAKDTLSLLWGSPFALSPADICVLVFLAVLLASYIYLSYRNMLALFFNREVAAAMGVRVKLHYTVMVLTVAFVVALAMKLLGAFLIDALLILPVLCASSFIKLTGGSGGIKRLFFTACTAGFFCSTAGYWIAVVLDLPPGATVALIAGIAYSMILICDAKKHGR